MTTWLKRAITCVSIAVIWTVLSACARGPADDTCAAAQRYYLMVFNDGLPGADAESQVLDAIASGCQDAAGFASVQRFQLNDSADVSGRNRALPKIPGGV